MNYNNPLKIREIFENMSYPKLVEDLSYANDFFNTMTNSEDCLVDRENGTMTPSNLLDLKNIMGNIIRTKNSFSNKDKVSFLLNLSKSIEKSSELICQIEAKCRGILKKDTQSQALPFLCESLVYYTSLATEKDDIKDLAVFVLCDDTFLGLLGPLIGAAVASGHRIILQSDSRIFPIIRFLISLAEKLENCPERMFSVVPYDYNIEELLENSDVKTVAVVGNFFQRNLHVLSNINLVAMETSFRAPMVVFSDADLDSVCETVIEAAWSYRSLLPWSVNQLIVQESVFELFLGKLKRRLSNVKVGTATQKAIDIAIPKYVDKVKEVVDQAKKMGLEVFQNDPDSETFQPTLIIGGKVFSNRVISEDSYAPVVQIFPFRTLPEGVALANNSRQGLAASVWTENIDTAEEVAEKLTVTNVWINTYGNFVSMAPINFRKMSGIGHLGGREGFMEFTEKNYAQLSFPLEETYNVDLRGILNDLKPCQESWKRLNLLERYKILSETIPADSLAKQFNKIFNNNRTFASNQGNYAVRCIKEARGVIMISYFGEECVYVDEVILASLLLGNSVIILKFNENDLLENLWPKNVPVKTHDVHKSCHENVVIQAMKYKEICAIGISNGTRYVPHYPGDMKKIFKIHKDWELTCAQSLSVIKNIWSTKQQTF